jgi:hypothetical protein
MQDNRTKKSCTGLRRCRDAVHHVSTRTCRQSVPSAPICGQKFLISAICVICFDLWWFLGQNKLFSLLILGIQKLFLPLCPIFAIY